MSDFRCNSTKLRNITRIPIITTFKSLTTALRKIIISIIQEKEMSFYNDCFYRKSTKISQKLL